MASPREHQHRVLFWGVLGLIVLRAATIGFGAALVGEFGWVLCVFAAFLIATGTKSFGGATRRRTFPRTPC